MRRMSNIQSALSRLAEQERAFLHQTFLAPVLRGQGVQVRIDGVRLRMRVSPRTFEGWGIFQPTSHAEARLVDGASLGQRRRYLDLFPIVRLVIARKAGSQWLGVSDGTSPYAATEILVAVDLAEDVELFDSVIARFDGGRLWFDRVDPRADSSAAAYLRQALTAMTDGRRLDRPGLTATQRVAYLLNYRARAQQMIADQRYSTERRLRDALDHAGAVLRDFSETGDLFRVTYAVGRQRHTSLVRQDDLTIVSSGICLSGQDRNFDLSSLIGVLREGGYGGG